MTNLHRRRRFWPAYLLGIGTTLCMGALIGVIAQPPAALAQIPDSGAQRIKMIREQQLTNKKLTEIVTLLGEIRDLQATAAGTEPSKNKTKSPRRRP